MIRPNSLQLKICDAVACSLYYWQSQLCSDTFRLRFGRDDGFAAAEATRPIPRFHDEDGLQADSVSLHLCKHWTIFDLQWPSSSHSCIIGGACASGDVVFSSFLSRSNMRLLYPGCSSWLSEVLEPNCRKCRAAAFLGVACPRCHGTLSLNPAVGSMARTSLTIVAKRL